MKLIIDIPEEEYKRWKEDGEIDAVIVRDALINGTPLLKVCDSENSEIKNEVKDLSKRVEALEKQIKEDKEEQLRKLEAELHYAKFRCALPTIMDMMSHN